MRTFEINEAQVQEIAGRLESIVRSGVGLSAVEHISAVVVLLGVVATQMLPGGHVEPSTAEPPTVDVLVAA